MWESPRDFQRVWEGWKAGTMAFHAFHALSFPWPAFGNVSSRKSPNGPEPQLRDIEFTQFHVSEVDPKYLFIHLLEAEILERKHLADEDTILVPADVAARVHTPGLKASGIAERCESPGEHDRAALVEACRRRVVDSFVRSFMVEDLSEAIELLLLQPEGQGWRLRRIFLQRAVHSLMTSVLLRSAWLDPFVHYAQLRPAERQFGQSEQAVASERRAVVGPDPCRHAVFVHRGLTDRDYLAQVHAQDRLAAYEVATVCVGDRERITPSAVACTEVSLEVHAPELVRRSN
jgi:hypothetical protein